MMCWWLWTCCVCCIWSFQVIWILDSVFVNDRLLETWKVNSRNVKLIGFDTIFYKNKNFHHQFLQLLSILSLKNIIRVKMDRTIE